MAYTPINKRTTVQGKTTGYIPVSQRKRTENLTPSPGLFKNIRPSFAISQSTSPVPTGPSTADLAKGFAQGIGRGYLATGQGIYAGNFNEPFVQQPADTFLGQLTRRISGTDQPISGAKEDVAFLGERYGTQTGGIVTAALTSLDLFGGSGARGLAGVTKEIRAAKTAEDAAKAMRIAGFSEDIIANYSPIFAKLDDTKEIEKGLIEAERLQNTTKTRVGDYTPVSARTAPKTAEEFVAEKNLASGESLSAETVRRALSGASEDKRLLSSESIPIYRAGTSEIRAGDFVTTERAIAEKYVASRPGTTILNIEVPQNTLIRSGKQGEFVYAPPTTTKGTIATPQTSEVKPSGEVAALRRTLEQTPQGGTQRVLQEPSPAQPQAQVLQESLPETLPQRSQVVESKAPIAVDEATYHANRVGFKRGTLTKVREAFKDTKKSIGQGADVLLGTISTRLKNIDPSLKAALRRYEFNLGMAIQKDQREVTGFLRGIKKSRISADDYADLDLALKNGDAAKTNELIEKYGLTEEFAKVRKTLDSLYARAEAVGYDIGYQENYFPRTIKDSGGLLEYLQRGDDWSIIDETIKAKEVDIGRYLSVDEKANLINSLIRGYGSKITLSETGAMKARRIDLVDAELNQFYNDSVGSLLSYITNTNDAIEARKFFGKSIKTAKKAEEFGNIEDSIGKYVLDLLVEGKIKPSQEKELSKILKARFNEVGTTGFTQTYKNLAYIDTMGSPISAITQIGDLSFSLYKAGPLETAKAYGRALVGKSKITREDIGIDKIAAEFSDSTKTAKAVDMVFRAVGLTKLDTLGKETVINATMSRLAKQAAKPTDEFYAKLSTVFGDDPAVLDMVTNDLKNGRVTEDTKLLAFNELLEVQPVALSEMPEMYLRGGNGRIFYMLKTYTIKLFDIYRNEVFSQMKTNPVKALKNLVALSAALTVMNVTADEIKDLVLNRETKMSDRVVDNILKLAGFSKYTIYKAREEGIGSAVARTVLPPFKLIDSAYKDITRQNEVDQLETIESIPIGGKLYYWWFGKGATKSEKKRNTGGDSGIPQLPELPSLPQLPNLPSLPKI